MVMLAEQGSTAMSLLHIQLLGNFRLIYAGQPLNTVNQPRVQSLLAYLLLHRQAPQPRHHLAFTFWPDVNEAHARNNLRQMLHQLRHALPAGHEFLLADANNVQWSPTAPFELDVEAFAAAAADAARLAQSDDKPAACRALQAALDRYTGDLLPACYDDWIGPEREHLRDQALAVGRQLVHLLEGGREYKAAIEAARRLLQLDALDEGIYAALMRLHALNNDRAAALRVYHDCVAILQRELEVEPSDEVQAAYARLLHLGAQETAAQPRSPATGLPLVGRHAEWEKLRTIWQQSARGQPAFALITGEAGIGKSRLAEELYAWAARQGIAAARTRAYAAEGRLSYAPITEWLRSPALAPALARLDTVWLGEIARLLPELLAAHVDLPPPTPLTEHWQRRRFYEALARGVLAGGAPILLLIDDLQWCDPETLEWLRFLLRFDSQARLLVVGTARSEEMGADTALLPLLRALQAAGQLHELALPPLDAAAVAELGGRVGKRKLDSAEAVHLMRESEGVPLFVVEMVRAGADPTAAQPLAEREFSPSAVLPPRMYAVIAGRLDQLSGPARELAGVAATIGRAFTVDVLARACGMEEDAVLDALEELWQRRIVREQGATAASAASAASAAGAINVYDFSHDKLRDVAYGELSPPQRRRLHRRVAEALHALHAADLDPVAAQLAAHYEQAGLAEQAIPHYQQAAAAARRLLAYADAIGHLRRGLALLEMLPASAQRRQQALALLLPLGTLLAATEGHADLRVQEIYTQALDLCRLVGDGRQTFVVQQELRICAGQRGELLAARRLADANLVLAEELGDPELLRYAHLGVAVIGHAQGELGLAVAHFARSIDQPVAAAGQADSMFFDNALQGSLRHSALTLWLLGCPDQARARMDEALALGRQQPQSVRYGMTLYFAAMLHHYLGETQGVQLRAEQLKTLAATHGYTFHALSGSIFEAWALVQQGRSPTAIAQLRRSLEARRAGGHRLFLPYEIGLLGEACLHVGDAVDGLAAVHEALAVAAETGERVWEAELLRLRAALLAAQDAPEDEIEKNLRQALQLARLQEAKSLELRAAVCLARLWQHTGRSSAAHQLLAPICAWFTEGFETRDLQNARILLA